ncbi:MAG: NADH ubiquinone oxidoreductase [Dehalococcoidia bacterium]|nr:NADH ubiquinone oxidoreductase [Dehalococcoidia bacterium]|tara:strand:- start:17986 stop:18585 length:600 start_codon:yes stop_codon:yes gene_type:complete
MNNLHKYFIILLIIGGLISIGYFVYLRLNSENLNSETMIIDNLTPEKNQKWVFFTDRVMGGVSSGKLEIGSEDGSKFYRMTGNVSTANNGGFIQFQADLSNISNTEEVFNGIKIKVRGNNENYQIFIRTNLTVLPWQYYSSEFYASNQWKEIKLPFNSFKRSNFYQPKNINNTDIRTLGIVAYGKDYSADLNVGLIEFY